MRRACGRLLRARALLGLALVVAALYATKELLDRPAPPPPAPLADDIPIFVPRSYEKIDWHDYARIAADKARTGPGEQGAPAALPGDSAAARRLFAANGFNAALSDRLALDRALPDIRHQGCRAKTYLKDLPTVSVVVPFHNEHWSTLLRTARAAADRSPRGLLKEIILVDDASTKVFLKHNLSAYLRAARGAVRVVRLRRRGGLVAARLAGARAAAGDVLVFLDSHTEPAVNWLPPLLEPIAMDYKTVVCPFIDVIDYETFEYRAQDEGARGGFDWELYYKRLPLLSRDQENMPEPFESPVMAGGLFAISRAWFWQLGGYDPGLDIWGGEQYELSFKIWQCGGRMLDAPCARVGHVYRKFAPFPNPRSGDFVGENYRRVAAVWMDEYAEHVYARRPQYRALRPGGLAARRALRRRLRCRSFKWFLHKVAFDLMQKYPPVEPPPYAAGRISPAGLPAYCMDMQGAAQGGPLRLAPCGAPGGEQLFDLTWNKDIKSRARRMCWDVPGAGRVTAYECHGGGGNQLWRYDATTRQLIQGDREKADSMCLDLNPEKKEAFVTSCTDADTQQWNIDDVNLERLAKWNEDMVPVTGPIDY